MAVYLQTLDIARYKPFKDHLRMEINDYIENRMEKNKRENFAKSKKPARGCEIGEKFMVQNY